MIQQPRKGVCRGAQIGQAALLCGLPDPGVVIAVAVTYIADFLLRKQGLTLTEAASVIAAPFWSTIERRAPEEREQLRYLRTVFPSLLITGPFSIVLGFTGGLMALNDRLKLRSMVTAEKGDRVYIASEEAAIRAMEPAAENLYAPAGGEPVIVKVREGAAI